MENKDLGNKKINNEQDVNEGFSGEHIPSDYNPAKGKLQAETETDDEGNTKKVDRARNPDGDSEAGQIKKTASSQSDSSSEEQLEREVENKDRNSDVATNRYPNSHPDNHKNRGNMELDEDK